jgi:hypothetical protein
LQLLQAVGQLLHVDLLPAVSSEGAAGGAHAGRTHVLVLAAAALLGRVAAAAGAVLGAADALERRQQLGLRVLEDLRPSARRVGPKEGKRTRSWKTS